MNDDLWTIDSGYVDPDDLDERERVRREAVDEVLDRADCKKKRGIAVNVSHLHVLDRTTM